MPRSSGFPMLMRLRRGLPAHEGSWLPLQMRNTIRSECDIPGKPGIICQVRNERAFEKWSDMPMLITCTPRDAVFALGHDCVKSYFNVRAASESTIESVSTTGAVALGRKLHEIFDQYQHQARPLLELIGTAALGSTVRAHRHGLLAQAMDLPVFEELKFPPAVGIDGARSNACLRNHGVLFRVSRPSPSKKKPQGLQISMCKYTDWQSGAFQVTDGIDIFLWLVAERRQPSRLSSIGLLPKEALVSSGIISASENVSGVRHLYMKWKSDEEIDFSGAHITSLAPYFIHRSATSSAIRDFAERILLEVSSATQSRKADAGYSVAQQEVFRDSSASTA
ncbi:unnamed protein product [Amoebophrya sp. A120]|nr:unnamed protein product [Amoebophrya sp. A120]|eukprot:GSA120T00001094001.1